MFLWWFRADFTIFAGVWFCCFSTSTDVGFCLTRFSTRMFALLENVRFYGGFVLISRFLWVCGFVVFRHLLTLDFVSRGLVFVCSRCLKKCVHGGVVLISFSCRDWPCIFLGHLMQFYHRPISPG